MGRHGWGGAHAGLTPAADATPSVSLQRVMLVERVLAAFESCVISASRRLGGAFARAHIPGALPRPLRPHSRPPWSRYPHNGQHSAKGDPMLVGLLLDGCARLAHCFFGLRLSAGADSGAALFEFRKSAGDGR